jgi:YggT family protein
MPAVQLAARTAVFAAFAASVLVALAGWLVRTRRVSPFGPLGRALRRASDPVLRPVETRLVRLGGNPVHAGWWLVVGVAAAGVLLLAGLNWAMGVVRGFLWARAAGPRGSAAFLADLAYRVLVLALVVRVAASWFGYGRYTRWTRPTYVLTDWLVEPVRRLLPPMGRLDWSPLVAWLVLWLLRQLVLAAALG